MSVRPIPAPDLFDLTACAECGHLHFGGVQLGYSECPVEACGCQGQAWRDEPAVPTRDELRPGMRQVGGEWLYSSAWL